MQCSAVDNSEETVNGCDSRTQRGLPVVDLVQGERILGRVSYKNVV